MKNKKITKKMLALICATATAVSAFGVIPVYADATKVVSIGDDLTKEQKQTMLRYFNVSKDPSVQRITVTNKDEVNHLSSYIPREQIGTRTVSCSYIKPTESGGIRVKTANLEYVTANMIASTLADIGIQNCEVVAACPFKVSGTGALTGIIMAYETATGEEIDNEKKELAAQEVVIVKDLADNIGTEQAETIINQAKIEAVQNNITNVTEIQNTITNIVNENNVTITDEQVQNIADLTQNVVNQGYGDDYVEVITDIGKIDDKLEKVEDEFKEEVAAKETIKETESPAEDSITAGLDESVLGEDIIVSATEETDLDEVLSQVEVDQQLEKEPEDIDNEDDITTVEETTDEELPIPDASKYGFDMRLVVEKVGEDAAREFLKIEQYLIEHFPDEWTEDEMRTREVKPEEKMSEIADILMNAYYDYLLAEEKPEMPLFDTFMIKVTELMDEGKLTEDEATGLHGIAPVDNVENKDNGSASITVEGAENAGIDIELIEW